MTYSFWTRCCSFCHASSKTANASAVRAGSVQISPAPSRLDHRNCSKKWRLSAVIADFGHDRVNMPSRPHTGFPPAGAAHPAHAQFRAFARPLALHRSQFHAAGEEYWKWNAIRSFFFRLPKDPVPLLSTPVSPAKAAPGLFQSATPAWPARRRLLDLRASPHSRYKRPTSKSPSDASNCSLLFPAFKNSCRKASSRARFVNSSRCPSEMRRIA